MRRATSNPHLRIDTRGPVEERYQILGRIAAGAMGQIYLARARLADGGSTEVALKRIKPELQKDRTFREMFYDEIRVASRMQHPNIIRLLEYGELDGSIFYAMELVPGINLADVLQHAFARAERLPLELVLSIGVQILDALDYAHNFTAEDGVPLHLVHRDVSPQNVLLAFDGALKLLDFGVTKAEGQLHKTQPGMIKGKLSYMSPEQIRSEPVDARTDLFALGVVLYEAAMLQHPFPGRTDPAVITAIMRTDPVAPHDLDPRFPRSVSEILLAAMQKRAGDRFESADAMKRAITGYMDLRGWGVTREVLARFLSSRFADRIAMLDRARQAGDDSGLVQALETGPKKALHEMPRLLAPPARVPPPLSSEEETAQELVPPSVRRRATIDTDDLADKAREGPLIDRIDRYALLERLHAGEREVYLARSERELIPKRVVIKRLSARAASDPAARAAFLEELGSSIEILHPNVVQVLEAGQHEGDPFAVMELVKGRSLDEVLDRCRTRRIRVPVGVSCRIIADLCRGLHDLHSRSILHRDVERKHVLITESGEVKLTHPRARSPSTPYTAPERLADGLAPESPASDVYSAGVLLFECLAANNPFEESSVLEASGPRLPVEGSAFPHGLEELVDRAMARAPDRRHETARALAWDLERTIFQKGAPVTPLEVAEWLGALFPDTGAPGR